MLQNTCLKWFTAIVALQLQDLIMAITPLQQKGCVQGRFIFDHLWDAFGSWQSMSGGLSCFVDVSKAYDSVAHEYCSAFFTFMGLPEEHVNILLQGPHSAFPAWGHSHGQAYTPSIRG